MSLKACAQASAAWPAAPGTGLGERFAEPHPPIETTQKAICWPFVKPFDGLEPSTLLTMEVLE
jgi:hypothetical protein